jgi:hypothetical protein
MEEIGKAYRLPISQTQSGRTARLRLIAALKKRGYFPDFDNKNLTGPIYFNHHMDRQIGEITRSCIITTQSPELERILKTLNLDSVEETGGDRK